MKPSVEALFESELKRRAIPFTSDPKTKRYSVGAEQPSLVALETLAREYAIDGDPDCVPRFVEAMLNGGATPDWYIARHSILFALEPNDYADSPELRLSLSKRVDRVPILVDQRVGTWQWINRQMLETWGVTVDDATEAASAAAAAALCSAKLERSDVEGVTLGFFETALPLKSPLLLAPNLKEIVGPILGWPLHAVVPDQDFIYLWPVTAAGFCERMGAVVVREYSIAPHPVTTELFKISDEGMKAVGAFG